MLVYGGVNPIEPADANKVKHKDVAAKRTLHWIGFQQERASTEVLSQIEATPGAMGERDPDHACGAVA